MQSKKEMISELTNSAWSLVDEYYNTETNTLNRFERLRNFEEMPDDLIDEITEAYDILMGAWPGNYFMLYPNNLRVMHRVTT